MRLIALICWIYYIKNVKRCVVHINIYILYLKHFLFQFQKVPYFIKHKNLYWVSFFRYFVFVNDLSFTKCVTRKSFTAYLLASLLHSCFGRFGTIWMSALIYRWKKVRRRNLSDKVCIETNRALSRTVIIMKPYIVERSNFY